MEKRKTDYLEKLKCIRKDQWLIVLLVGILAVLVALPAGDRTKSNQTEDPVQVNAESMQETAADNEGARTIADMEKRLESILSEMDGAGEVRVMITGRDNGEKIVEKDVPTQNSSMQEEGDGTARSSTDSGSEETTVYVRDGNGLETPYVRQELAPEITGVLVLAEGGDNAVVEKNITDAVKALFGLEAHKIKVMKMHERRG